ncbi:hypothetical protein V2J09_002415 [Rumex salicifolius]
MRRDMFTTTHNTANLYAPTIGGGVAQTDSLLPFCNSKIGDVALHSTNYNQINIPPPKDDSGLTFNNYAVPFPRKRLRDSTMATTNTCNSNSPAGNFSSQCGGGYLSFLGEDLSLQLTQQQFEVDRLILLHMEKVRAEIEERTRKQSIRIIQAIQEAVMRKLTEKDEQIEKIGKLNWVLQERVKSLCLENQIWRDLAQTNEATANALRSNIEQVMLQANNKNDRVFSGARAGTAGDDTDDAESCCGSSGHGLEDGEDETHRWKKVARTDAGGERKRVSAEEEKRKRMCRRCGAAESCVLLLPCRHLCLCTACGPAVDACPVCNSIKNASVHVNLS